MHRSCPASTGWSTWSCSSGRRQPGVPDRLGSRPTAPRTSSWSPSSRAAESARLDDEGRVSIELGTVLGSIAQSLAAQGLVDADKAANLDASFAVMDADQLAKARRAYDTLDTLGFWLPLSGRPWCC